MVKEHQDIGDLRQSIQLQGWVVSMVVKSACKRSIGAVATIRCRGTLDKLPSCCKQCMQDLMDCCIWLAIPGFQMCSHNNDKVWSQPWWPTSLWHPFKMVTQWALGTMKSRRSLVSPLGIEHRSKVPWWIVKFCQFHRISQPSSPEVCSVRSAFKSVFCAFSQSKTALNVGSSFWALVQSVTCICTRAQPAVTCTSCSKWQSPLTTAGLWTLVQCTNPIATPLRIDFTMSRSSQVITCLSTSATVLLHPFWYSNSKLNYARAPTNQLLVVSRLGVIII